MIFNGRVDCRTSKIPAISLRLMETSVFIGSQALGFFFNVKNKSTTAMTSSCQIDRGP